MIHSHDALKALIKAKSFRNGQFVLASGKTANYFFDMKPTMLDPAGSNLIANAILDKINTVCGDVDAVGGMATGGIPLVSVVCAISFMRGTPIPALFVRKATKDHGTERLIEGVLEAGWTVVMLEDVTTTGGSIMQAVRPVRAAGGHVHHVITVVDRLEGAIDNLASEGITLHPIFNRLDFDGTND
jgi:orotate phosphoribosyltransferase